MGGGAQEPVRETKANGTARADVSSAQVDHGSGVWQDRGRASAVDVEETGRKVFEAFSKVEQSLQLIRGTPETVTRNIARRAGKFCVRASLSG
ncbi:MAG: hypothetical protein ACREQ4_06695 [Candidatus Binataceae bacterium]